MPMSPAHYNPVGFFFWQLCPSHLFMIILKDPTLKCLTHLKVIILQDLDKRVPKSRDFHSILDLRYQSDGIYMGANVMQQSFDKSCKIKEDTEQCFKSTVEYSIRKRQFLGLTYYMFNGKKLVISLLTDFNRILFYLTKQCLVCLH